MGKTKEDQGKRFIDAARELETDDDEAAFDERLRGVASAPPPKTEKPKKRKTPSK